MGSKRVNDIMYLVLRHIVFLVLLQVVRSTNHDLDITSCKQEWVRASATTTYSFRVDCANLGFRKVPSGIPKLTAELDLSGNDIVTLNESAFKDASKLERLYLSRNPIRCDTRIWWLVDFSKTLTNFSGTCLSPRPLRTKPIKLLKEEDLSVDCLSVKHLRKGDKDGEYTVRVFARDNSNTELGIYCHKMNTSSPKEFLTLPAGIHHNYVRVKTSPKCNYNQTDKELQDKLAMLPETTSYFVRVRIQLSTLRIITTDTTFGTNRFLNYGQPGLCGGKMCTGGYAKIDLRGTHFHIKDSKKIITTRKCNEDKCMKCNVSTSIALSMMDPRKYPFLACTLPLGLQNGKIKNSSITASTYIEGGEPHNARLNSLGYDGWCAESNSQNEYIMFDLKMVKTISGITTQGHKTQNNWVKKYEVLYSTTYDHVQKFSNFEKYREFGKISELKGNEDSSTVSTHWFQPRFRARYILVRPLDWNGNETNENRICMRIELYGCVNDITSYIIKPQLRNTCLTIDKDKKDEAESYPRLLPGCSGPDFMFTFQTNRLMHTQTGLCMNTNSNNELILSRQCSTSNIQFQRVRQKDGRQAFLIKDKEKCARIYNLQKSSGNMQILWGWCLKGGFSILFMTRAGVSSFVPNFAVTPNHVTTDLFKRVTFKCRARADPHVIFRWTKNSLDSPTVNQFKNGEITERTEYSVLDFRNVSWEDRGDYFCNAWNSKGNSFRKYTIEVNAMQWWERRPRNQKVIWGDTATFHCVSRGIPTPDVRWIKYSDNVRHPTPISNHTRYFILSNNTLLIKKVVYRDEGLYMCVSNSPKLVRNASATLDVHVTQNFTTVPKPKHVLFGEGTTFQCVSEGRPAPEVVWKMNLHSLAGQKPITIDQSLKHRYEVLPDKSLHVKTATFDDEGRFYCISKQPGWIVNASADLTVFVTQNFTVRPVDVNIYHGYNATFKCVTVGVPPPKPSWVKIQRQEGSGNVLEESVILNSRKYEISDDNTLVVRDVKYSDEGRYMCLSKSPRLERNVSALLQVKVSQNFTTTPQNTDVLFGYNATFKCVSIGIPIPIVSWARKVGGLYEKLTTNEKYVIGPASLTIIDARYEDELEYACFSHSPRLIRNATAMLNVYVEQKFEVAPEGSRVLYAGYYMLHCKSTGIPPPTISWYFKHVSKKQPNIVATNDKMEVFQNGSLALKDATLGESGVYYCVSDSPGYRVNSSANVEVYVTQEFTNKPKSLTLIKGDEAQFNCTSVGSPIPQISWKYERNGFNELVPIPRPWDDRHKVLPNNTLVIKDVKNDDEGKYVCLSKSPGLLVNQTARLVVYIAPSVVLSRSSKHLHIGQSTSVRCQVSGDPPPVINWYKLSEGGARERQEAGGREELVFRRVRKEDEGTYQCEANNVVRSAKADYNLIVTATCLLDLIEYSSHTPKKYEFNENEKVRVKCNKGFQIVGSETLTCTHSGHFDQPLPVCVDINECNNTISIQNDDGNVITGSGLDPNDVIRDQSDDEVDACGDDYAQCVNTIGSYDCVCEEGYVMLGRKCEFEPNVEKAVREGKSEGGGSRSTLPPPTMTPPPYLNTYFRTLRDSYESDKTLESDYLSRLLDFSTTIKKMKYDNWKVDGISKIIQSLEVAVKLADRHKAYATSQTERNAIKIFGKVVNEVLNKQLENNWKDINEKSNGSVKVMKYMENYIQEKVKVLKMEDFNAGSIEESFDNMDIKIVAVTDDFMDRPLQISMLQGDEGNTVVIPPENYQIFKKVNAGVVISYKNLHKVFPKPRLPNLESAKLQTRILTLSFLPGTTQLSKPMQLTFKVDTEKPIPARRYCSYWDFGLPYGGGWSSTGCSPLNISTASEVICECTHLSNFALIVPEKTAQRVAYLTFTLSVAVGVAACIILAFCTCMSHVCCTSYAHGDRRAIMTNITIVLILGLLVFAGAVLMSSMGLIKDAYSTYFCFSLIGIVQLLAVACFGWLFSESIHILFSTRPVIEKRSSNLCLFYILGWVVPVGLLAITGVLVYLDKFQLQSRCSLQVSFYLIGILVGAPSACYIIATVVLYMLICVSTSKNSEILGAMKVSHARRSLLCSGFLILFHLTLLGAVTLYLHFNGDAMFHHILGGVAASEGIYLIIYHMFLDRMAARTKINGGSPRGARQRNSYSTKEITTFASNGNVGNGGGSTIGTVVNEEPNPNDQTRFLIKASSKRPSIDHNNMKPTPPQLRTPEENNQSNTLEWDSHVGGDMYGDTSTSPQDDVEMKPMLQKHPLDDLPDTIFEDEKDFGGVDGLETFGQPYVERNGTIPRSYNSLPRQPKKSMTRDFDEVSADGSFRYPTKKQPPGKSPSIVSIETHTSDSSKQGLPVYFPSAPPHHEIFFDQDTNGNKLKKPEPTTTTFSACSTKSEDELDPASRPTSFGIDSDRMSNLSSELSNILYELQAFNTERHPSETQGSLYDCDVVNAATLPHRTTADPGPPDLSRSVSTFKPGRAFAKTEVQPQPSDSIVPHHRVRVLRGRSRADADPSDGLHGNSDSIYSSL